MRFIIITYPDSIPDEANILSILLKNGLDTLHLRKPGLTKNQYINLLKNIPVEYHNKIVIYNHHELISEYNLKGIHFNYSNLYTINEYNESGCSKSCSFHFFDEIMAIHEKIDYCFLSPVFQSISKTNYKPKYTLHDFYRFLSSNSFYFDVFALGGITRNNMKLVRKCGFNGIAILGDFWNGYIQTNNVNYLLNYLIDIKKQCAQTIPM